MKTFLVALAATLLTGSLGVPTAQAATTGLPSSALCAESSTSTRAAALPKIKVWMAGDSTMMNASTCPIGWGSRFAPYFTTDITVQNSAVGGRSIQTWLYEGNVTGTKNPAGECTLSSTA